MDRAVNRINEAFMAATRIINEVEGAGFNISDPYSIINGSYEYWPDYLQYSYGASRLVIWDTECCDYVLKIALNEDYEKYCQREVEIYQAAVREGMADNFAWCMCYAEPCMDDDFYNAGIYVMEYVDCDSDTVYDSAWRHGYEEYCEMKGFDSSLYDHCDEFDRWNCAEEEDMILECIGASMSDNTFKMFNRFLYDWRVSDIHSENAGFLNGKMVLTDYAGWGW